MTVTASEGIASPDDMSTEIVVALIFSSLISVLIVAIGNHFFTKEKVKAEARKLEADPYISEYSVLGHISELRRLLLRALIPTVIGIVVISMTVGRSLMLALTKPARAIALSIEAGSPVEFLKVLLQLSTVVSLVVMSPLWLLMLGRWIIPGLTWRERRYVYVLAPVSFVLFVLSIPVTLLVTLPVVLVQLSSMEIATLGQGWQLEPYFSLVQRAFMLTALIFEIPVLMTLLLGFHADEAIGLTNKRFTRILFAFGVSLAIALVIPFITYLFSLSYINIGLILAILFIVGGLERIMGAFMKLGRLTNSLQTVSKAFISQLNSEINLANDKHSLETVAELNKLREQVRELRQEIQDGQTNP